MNIIIFRKGFPPPKFQEKFFQKSETIDCESRHTINQSIHPLHQQDPWSQIIVLDKQAYAHTSTHIIYTYHHGSEIDGRRKGPFLVKKCHSQVCHGTVGVYNFCVS